MPENRLYQVRYCDDGVYRFECGVCGKNLDVQCCSLSNYSSQRGVQPLPERFPIQFCWNCGIKFDKCVW